MATQLEGWQYSPAAADHSHQKQLEEVSPDTSFSDYSKQHVGGEWSAVIYTEGNAP
jgi:hypothetical protein